MNAALTKMSNKRATEQVTILRPVLGLPAIISATLRCHGNLMCFRGSSLEANLIRRCEPNSRGRKQEKPGTPLAIARSGVPRFEKSLFSAHPALARALWPETVFSLDRPAQSIDTLGTPLYGGLARA